MVVTVPDRHTTDPAARCVGRVERAHGVRGEVVVAPDTDAPELRFATGSVLGAAGADEPADPAELVVASARPHRGRLLVRFEGIDGRAAADALRGAVLTVRPAELCPPTDPEEFHDHALENLTAVRVDGSMLGTVRAVRHAPGNDVLVLTSERGELLVPFVRAIVPEVDTERGRIVIDPPDGLLDG